MGKAMYACTNCKKTFSRKYNAERHNKDIHNEMAVIYNKENDWVSEKRKIGNVAVSTTGATPVSTIAAENPTENKNNKKIAEVKPKHPNINLKDFAHNSEDNLGADTDVDVDDKTVKLLNFIEKLMPFVDELDVLLTRYIETTKKRKIVSDTITQSLMSQDPFKFINDKISFHRADLGLLKACGSIALSENISPQQAEQKLRLLVWNSPYFKRNLSSSVY